VRDFLVFDTNVLISGYLWSGKPRQAIRVVQSGAFRLLYCRESIDELIRVLSTKFDLSAAEIYAIVSDLRAIGKNIGVHSKENPIEEDPTDNLFINLATDGNARMIVSGNSHLLNLKRYKEIEVIKVSDFLKHYTHLNMLPKE
jgi:putative PIN family toxin of toxin-antitoxin system